MRRFWKCLIVSKTLVKTKSKFYPFEGNCDLISIFRPISPKSENHIKNPNTHSPNVLMLNEEILEMPYFQLNFGKDKLETLPI